jgi:hypothetical protein
MQPQCFTTRFRIETLEQRQSEPLGVRGSAASMASSSKASQDDSVGLPLLLERLAAGERHPVDSQVDYAAIYRCLASLCAGEVPEELNVATSDKLTQVMSRLLRDVFAKRSRGSLDNGMKTLEHFRLWAREQSSTGPTSLPDGLSHLNPFELAANLFHSDVYSSEDIEVTLPVV